MTRHRTMILVLALGVTAAACDDDLVSSETHFLSSCDSDADCGELTCECGVCTTSCAGAAECGELGECAAPSSSAADALCEQDRSEGLCLPVCVMSTCDVSSGPGLACAGGHCIPESRCEPGSCGGTGDGGMGAVDMDAGAEPEAPIGGTMFVYREESSEHVIGDVFAQFWDTVEMHEGAGYGPLDARRPFAELDTCKSTAAEILEDPWDATAGPIPAPLEMSSGATRVALDLDPSQPGTAWTRLYDDEAVAFTPLSTWDLTMGDVTYPGLLQLPARPTMPAGWATGVEVARSAAHTLTWEPQGGEFIDFLLITSDGFVECRARDDGEFQIPASRMAALPVGDGHMAGTCAVRVKTELIAGRRYQVVGRFCVGTFDFTVVE